MNTDADIEIFPPIVEDERQWLADLWHSEWGGDTMVSRGHVYRLADLQALVAKAVGELVGAATYRFDDAGGCELMSINAVSQGGGVGTRFLNAVEDEARRAGCQRVWLITSNDNLDALRFYQRRGYRITAIYPGAIDEARRIKPTIPIVGDHGIEIHDEIELSKTSKETPPMTELETDRLLLRPYTTPPSRDRRCAFTRCMGMQNRGERDGNFAHPIIS